MSGIAAIFAVSSRFQAVGRACLTVCCLSFGSLPTHVRLCEQVLSVERWVISARGIADDFAEDLGAFTFSGRQ